MKHYKFSFFFFQGHGENTPEVAAKKMCLIATSYLGAQNDVFRIADTTEVTGTTLLPHEAKGTQPQTLLNEDSTGQTEKPCPSCC